jgi:hypothetical protein
MHEISSDESPASNTFRPRKMQSCTEALCCGSVLPLNHVSRDNLHQCHQYYKFAAVEAIVFLLPAFMQVKRPTNVLASHHLVFREVRQIAFSCQGL